MLFDYTTLLISYTHNGDDTHKDLLIHSSTFTEHLHHIDLVLDKSKSAGFTVNISKCQFCKAEINFLGHIISDEGVKADLEGTEAIFRYLYLRTKESFANSWEYVIFIRS